LGPEAVRLTHGRVTYPQGRPHEAEFQTTKFPDLTKVKWLCLGCADEHRILHDDFFGLSEFMQNLQHGWCCLCKKDIQPYPIKDWSSALNIELVQKLRSTRGNAFQFYPIEGASGHVHWGCMDDLGLEMNCLVEDVDAPDEESFCR
jgi:hypothetical protein